MLQLLIKTFFSSIVNPMIGVMLIVNIVLLVSIKSGQNKIIAEMEAKREPELERKGLVKPIEDYIIRCERNYPEWSKKFRDISKSIIWYDIITVLFPFLGILGTVLALLTIKPDFNGVDVNFLQALTSTFWGLIAAIISKIGEGFISPDYERLKTLYELITKDGLDNYKKQAEMAG